ncbi:MAG: ATP-binding protein [Ignavibacteriae bacterium]|nr:ATP-binding protein [Ignavibacteriota bacterium]
MNSKKFIINSEYKNVNSVCFITKTFCEDHLISDNSIREIELSIAEALNNIIKHAYKGEENNTIEISMEVKNKIFKIILTDYGIERSNLNKPTLDFDPNDIESLPEGGMGLFIIEQLMDETNYLREGNKNIFTMVKNLK